MEYEAVIGLETHVQLKTKSKMWCGCANEFGALPNTHVCPVCLGLPGVLPVPNEEALKQTVLAGLLLNCEIPRFAKFDRKNYFYPDAPKNYQITQFDKPSTIRGHVDFEFQGGISRVHVTRAHLEEDVGKNFHFDRMSGVDFNRAGVPLLEIVSEPDITSPDMAYAYLNALTEILRYGGISECNMEEGMVRCDVNVSVRPVGQKEFGAKIEIKNMNSFSGARRALEYEIPRQIEVLQSGGKLFQCTSRWDDAAGITEVMRTKEQAHDYRYFPEPDLMPVAPTDDWLADLRKRASEIELPLAKKRRLKKDYGLENSDQTYLTNYPVIGAAFEYFAKNIPEDAEKDKVFKPMANYLINNLGAEFNAAGQTPTAFNVSPTGQAVFYVQTPSGQSQEVSLPPRGIYDLAVAQAVKQEISSSGSQIVFKEMCATGQLPSQIIEKLGLRQVSDTGAIEKFCDDALAANPKSVADYKSGNVIAINFLKGQVMKLSKGKANPALVGDILERKLRE